MRTIVAILCLPFFASMAFADSKCTVGATVKKVVRSVSCDGKWHAQQKLSNGQWVYLTKLKGDLASSMKRKLAKKGHKAEVYATKEKVKAEKFSMVTVIVKGANSGLVTLTVVQKNGKVVAHAQK